MLFLMRTYSCCVQKLTNSWYYDAEIALISSMILCEDVRVRSVDQTLNASNNGGIIFFCVLYCRAVAAVESVNVSSLDKMGHENQR